MQPVLCDGCMMRTECPKCTSKNAWFERTGQDIVLRCTCGYHRVVLTRIKQIEIRHVDTADDVKLPRRDTHLWNTLMTLHVLIRATSAEVTRSLKDSGAEVNVSDVSSYLTILSSKGLSVKVDNKRGIVGGSTWEVTTACKKLIGE